MDIAEASSQPIEVVLGGTTFRARALKLSEWGGLMAWFKRAVPSPVERVAESLAAAKARGSAIPPDVAELMADQAIQAAASWPPRIGTLEWLRALDSAEGGIAEFLFHALRRENPDFSREDAAGLAGRVTLDDVFALESVVLLGKLPDPKSPAPTPTPAPASPPSGHPSGTTGAGPSPPL